MASDTAITCTVNMEWTNKQGIIQRKVSHKSATLRLIRNELRQIFVEISSEKGAPVRLQLKAISVHKKFMNEGKASIKFQEVNCMLYLSNAPPGQLLSFLRTLFVKMTGEKTEGSADVSLRTQLLSNKSKKFDEISPVTTGELDTVRSKLSRATSTTPSPIRKRKLNEKDNSIKAPAAKKLYTSSSPVPNEPLDLEQREVLEACLAGLNIFFTGSAGTGKSYLLRKIIGALPPDVTVATASTGVAACHIGGITLHQFAGIGGGDATLERSVEMASKPNSAAIWRKCKHLIIDEISMIDGDYFEKIEHVARKVRRNDKPFGGIQLILCGDFLQLPPVSKRQTRFCFQTKAWTSCVQRTFELKRVHRQNEQDFIDILNEIRIGRITDDTESKLTATAKQKIEQDGILATRLCSHTQDADIINESKLKALTGGMQVFNAEDSDGNYTNQLNQQTPVPGKLELKVGAQVMLLKNINIQMGLVNGARGVVKSFKEGLPVVQFRRKEYLARPERWAIKSANGATFARRQVPLRLAWAFSIHKSQGLTLDCVEMSLAKVFEAGQAYVALSRAQSIKTLRVLDFKAAQVWANPDVLAFYNRIRFQEDVFRPIPLGNKIKKSGEKKTLKGLSSKILGKPIVSIS